MDHSDRGYRVHSTARSNQRVESTNTSLRVLARLAFGFHSPKALIGPAMLGLGGLCPPLPGRAAVPV